MLCYGTGLPSGRTQKQGNPYKEQEMNKIENKRSELWEPFTEQKIKQKMAGYKAACVRALMKATTKSQRNQIVEHYANAINNMFEECEEHNARVVRHNAAVKAHATRRSMKSNSTTCNKANKRYSSCVCTRVSKRK